MHRCTILGRKRGEYKTDNIPRLYNCADRLVCFFRSLFFYLDMATISMYPIETPIRTQLGEVWVTLQIVVNWFVCWLID